MRSLPLTSDYLSRFDVLSSFARNNFAPLPTLQQAVTQAFTEALAQQYPGLNIQGAALKIAVPLSTPEPAYNAPRRYRFITPAQLMIERFTGVAQRTLRQDVHWLTTDDNAEALSLLAVNMRDMESMVADWTPQVIPLFKQALACFWGELSAAGKSPLTWLGQTLKAGLYSAALNTRRTPALTQKQLDLATEVVLTSHKQHRLRPRGEVVNRAYVVDIDTTREGRPWLFRLPGVAVLERVELTQTTWLAYTLEGGIETFESRQAFAATIASRLPQPLPEDASWSFDEPEDEFFVALAHTLLDKQLEDISAMAATARAEHWSAARLEHALAGLTQMFDLFSAGERSQFDNVADKFPAWLDRANAEDQLAYSALLAGEVRRQSEVQGHSFLDGIDSLPDYASHQLRTRMLQDHPDALGLDVADIEVHDLSIENLQMAWLTEDVMSLVDMALTYIGGKPPGFLSVRGRNGVTLPPWMDAGYAKRLVMELDVGSSYIALLKRVLIEDEQVANTRRVLFKDQLRNQLPMLALEKKIKNESAITASGVDIVHQLMRKDRLSATDSIVIRPLEFSPYSSAPVDTVANMFILGTRQKNTGPFVLYSPFSHQVLREFASWPSLFDAIRQPGELNDHVMEWMPPQSRKYYVDGGFDRPHLESVMLEGQLALLPRSPATLSERVLVGDHFEFMYDSNTSALVQLADQQSVSVSERRWALFKQCAWTLFNGLTFFISGPLAKAAWLFQVLVSIDAGLQARIEGNKPAASQSVIDLLFMISLTLLHRGLTFEAERHQSLMERAMDEPLFSVPEEKKLQPASATLQARAPGTIPAHGREEYSQLDFSWFGASPQMTANQAVAIQTFSVNVDLSKATKIEVGPYKGTYNYLGKRWVKIKDAVYRVSREPDGLVIQDNNNVLRVGPWLRSDGPGHWDFDLRLRLRGGGPKKSVQALREVKAEKFRALNSRRLALIEQKKGIEGVMELTANLLKSATSRRVELVERYEVEYRRWYAKQSELLKLLDDMNDLSSAAAYEHDRIYGLSELARFTFDLQKLIDGEYRKLPGSTLAFDFSDSKFQAIESLAAGDNQHYENMIARLQVTESWEKKLVSTCATALETLQEIAKLNTTRDHNLKQINAITNRDPAWRYWSVVYVKTLLELLVRRENTELTPFEQQSVNYFDNTSLSELAMSQISLQADGRFSIEDRIKFFDSALHQYEVARLQCRNVLFMQSNAFRLEYVSSLLGMLEQLSSLAEVSFSNTIKTLENLVEEEPVASSSQQPSQAQSRPSPSAKPRKVFRTDKQQVLVGEVRDPVAGETGEVVDVIDSLSHVKVSSYRNTGGENWVEVDAKTPPVPRRAPQRRALSRLESQAQLHLEQVEGTIHLIRSQSKTAKIPLEMEDILVRKSQTLLDTARGIQDILSDANLAEGSISEVRARALRGTIAELELKAERLKQEGRQIRIDMIKEQPPTEERVDYLMTQGEINISRLGARRALSRGPRKDYLQEYEIKDKSGTPLWYAHFHYDTQDAAVGSYTAAHLKTLEQRTMSERALYAKARNSRDVIEVYRGKINTALANKLFIAL